MIRTSRTTCLALGFAAAVAGCSPVAEDDTMALMPATSAQEKRVDLERALETARDDCLLMVWSEQEERRVEFDRTHDQVKGGAISCATGTTASQFDAAIIAIREAARSGNKARMLEEIGIPLMYIDASGERRPIEDRETVEQLFDEVFDASMLATLERLDLEDITVVPDQGAFFELGSLWLVVGEKGGRPSIVTVNRQALDDAAEAARDKADRRETTPLPET
ncbi:hypothetical protein [Qipengyuania sp. MTN3-11]|uniref:hypothetical protein n=1 Tax=Qipengyuania sp. MTN3-11 TaxID=3056557 RepID=UPI0036F27D28